MRFYFLRRYVANSANSQPCSIYIYIYNYCEVSPRQRRKRQHRRFSMNFTGKDSIIPLLIQTIYIYM